MEGAREPAYQFVICPDCGWKNLRTDAFCRKCDKPLRKPDQESVGVPGQPTLDEMAEKATFADLYKEVVLMRREKGSDAMIYAGIAAMALGVGLLVLVVGSPIFAAIVAAFSIIVGIVLLIAFLGY